MNVLYRLARRLQDLVEQSYEPGFTNSPAKIASLRGAADSLASVALGMVEDEKPEPCIIRTVQELEAANKAQAEKIKRLQAALREADKDSFWASSDRYVGVKQPIYEEPDWEDYNLLPGDMEATDE